MLHLFRKNRLQNYFIAFIYVVLLRMFTFFTDYGAVEGESIAYDLLGWNFSENQAGYKLVSILMIFYQFVLINRLSTQNNLSYGNSLFPGIFYVLVLSLIPDLHPMSTILVGNTFLILAITHLFQTIHRNQRSKRLFNSGFFAALAVFSDLNFIYLVPFLIVAANTIILVRPRDIFLYILGFLVPLYFLSAYWILQDVFLSAFQEILNSLVLFRYEFVYQSYGIIKASLIGVFVLGLLAVIQTVVTRTNIFVRNKLTFLYYLMVYSALIFGLCFRVHLEELQLILLPVGFLLGLYVLNIRKIPVAESIHLLILILAVLFQYFLI